MKRLLIVLAFAGVSMISFAQESTPVQKYSVATNSFWSNWFIQANVAWNAYYSDEEHGNDYAVSPFKKFRSNPGVSIAVGKWFSPEIGLRTKVQGIWGKQVGKVNGDDNFGNHNSYWTANEHVMLNLSNIFCGYNPNRVWNVIPFIGGGISRSMTYGIYAMQLSGGLLNEFQLNKRVALNVEIGWNRMEEDLDGQHGPKPTARPNSRRGWEDKDNHVYAEVGLTFNIGKTGWSNTPDVDAIKALSQSQIDALNAQLNDANAENGRLKQMLANQKPAQTIKEFVATQVSVFFDMNKAKIASKKDIVNVKALAEYAKKNNSNVVVTGYADSATGSKEYNQTLSENRAKAVADELVSLGVSRDKIQVVGKGGVGELTPVSFNRRAIVQIAD